MVNDLEKILSNLGKARLFVIEASGRKKELKAQVKYLMREIQIMPRAILNVPKATEEHWRERGFTKKPFNAVEEPTA